MISDHYGCQAASIKSYEEITLDVRNQTTNTHGGHGGTLPAPSQRRSRDGAGGGQPEPLAVRAPSGGSSGAALRSAARWHREGRSRVSRPSAKGPRRFRGLWEKGFGKEILPEARAISKQFPLPCIIHKIKCRSFFLSFFFNLYFPPLRTVLAHHFSSRSLSLRF